MSFATSSNTGEFKGPFAVSQKEKRAGHAMCKNDIDH
jgi:hypothetical protein